ncbi:MAG: PhoX family phosphatase [Acidobacteria bacterium]|nr:PhoX family phosphatase [Acidobacteriota bacterium]
MSHADEVLDSNPSTHPTLDDVIQARAQGTSRREVLKGSVGFMALSFLGGGAATLLTACGGGTTEETPGTPSSPAPVRPAALGFTAVAKSLADAVSVPAGYSVQVVHRLGDPLAASLPAYSNLGTDAAAGFAYRVGDHHDGMHYFGLDASGKADASASTRALLAVNHEAITPSFLHPAGQTIVGGVRTVPEEVLREFYAHGVSISEIQKGAGGWALKQDSAFNRRVHTLTDMVLSGPASGTSYLVTRYSPNGTRTRGTVNNCANGYTPWGTYLTCEENWGGYFRRVTATDNANRSAKELTALARYGVAGAGRELWGTVTPDTPDDLYGRWVAEVKGASASEDYRNVANTYGWVVEIDPYDPGSTPRKRTALGRFAHEGAWIGKVETGKPLTFYMGCDSRNEYIYKFVSTALWDPADATGGLAAGDKYMDHGRLYVAKFNADGTGTWLELAFGVGNVSASTPAYAFADQADVLIHARLAADAQGATKMDRPEWGAVDPVTGAVYMTLTNNSGSLRSLAATDAANPRHYNDPRTTGAAQRGNPNGHVIRWMETGATSFQWDIFLFGSRAGSDPASVNLSGLTADNDFSSPDGLWFSRATNICWIQTDDGAYTDVTNCMLLAALPGTVGDGSAVTITNTDAGGATKAVPTRVGAQPGTRLRRFLVGPPQCELTGLAESPDGKTLFVNIQHPGEDTPLADLGNPSAWPSHWPDGGTARPRSATLAITRNDGGPIGL